ANPAIPKPTSALIRMPDQRFADSSRPTGYQNKKSPLPGGGGSGLDVEYGTGGGGAPHSASASHLGGVDGRHATYMGCLMIRQQQKLHSSCADLRRRLKIRDVGLERGVTAPGRFP
ncbi:hypothetical protein, partial [Mesorhizobium temperatum]|uniref:hypothetical protein n=1 Tax=Mesorhizobium temperatum TaxID=241416 RepID=UPI001980BD49